VSHFRPFRRLPQHGMVGQEMRLGDFDMKLHSSGELQ
jgi:hypothetical protein